MEDDDQLGKVLVKMPDGYKEFIGNAGMTELASVMSDSIEIPYDAISLGGLPAVADIAAVPNRDLYEERRQEPVRKVEAYFNLTELVYKEFSRDVDLNAKVRDSLSIELARKLFDEGFITFEQVKSPITGTVTSIKASILAVQQEDY